MLGVWAVLAFVVIAYAFLDWATTAIFSISGCPEFIPLVDVAGEDFTSNFFAVGWSAFNNLFTTSSFIDESFNSSFTSFATIWEWWSWAWLWGAKCFEVFSTHADFTFWRSFDSPVVVSLSVGSSSDNTTVFESMSVDIDFLRVARSDTFPFFAFEIGIPDGSNINNISVFFGALTWSCAAWFLWGFGDGAVIGTSITDTVMVPRFTDNNDHSLFSVFITSGDAAIFFPKTGSAWGFADYVKAGISVLPDKVTNSVSNVIDAASFDAARTLITFFGMGSGLAVTDAFNVLTSVSFMIPFSAYFNNVSIVIVASSDASNAFLDRAAFVSWVSFISDEVLARQTIWGSWAASFITDARLLWAVTGSNLVRFESFTSISGTTRESITFWACFTSFNITASDNLVTAFVVINKVVAWFVSDWASGWEAWSWAGDVYEFISAVGCAFVVLAKVGVGFVLPCGSNSNEDVVVSHATGDVWYAFVLWATVGCSGLKRFTRETVWGVWATFGISTTAWAVWWK